MPFRGGQTIGSAVRSDRTQLPGIAAGRSHDRKVHSRRVRASARRHCHTSPAWDKGTRLRYGDTGGGFGESAPENNGVGRMMRLSRKATP